MIQDSLANGRLVRNLSFTGVGLCRADDRIGLCVKSLFLNGHRGTYCYQTIWMVFLTFFDHAGSRKQHFQFLDAAFNKGLLILGSLIFGIFNQLTTFHRLMQSLGHFLPFDGTQVV